MNITGQYLKDNPNHVFVFGDNLTRKGYGGAAKLRDFKNTYGFITKISPSSSRSSFYKPHAYKKVFKVELEKLMTEIQNNPRNTYLISKLGSGFANRYRIFETIIEPDLKPEVGIFKNVKFLWEM